VTQLFVEALMLVLAGGLAGAAAGPWILDVFLSLSPVTLPAYVALTPDATTVGLAGAALAIAGIIAGTVPASVGRRVHPGDVLRDSGRGTLGRVAERRWTAILIAGEAALTLVLLVAGGLLVRSFDRLDSMEMGFDRARIARLAVTLNAADVGGSEGLPALFARLRERIATVPGVNRVGLVATTLPPWDADRRRLLLQGVDLDPRAEGLEAGVHYADEGLLPMLGTPVVSGRNIAAQDVVGSADIALVSRALADLVGGPEGAIGRIVTLLPETTAGARRDFRIIGVAENVAWDGLREQDTRRYIRYGDASDARAARYDVYLALAQSPSTVVSVGVWTAGDPSQMIEPVRRAIAAIVPRSAVHWTSTMDDEVALEYEASRFYSLIVAAFSLSALLLTSIGLFALLSHAAAQRMGEMGLRMALGAVHTPTETTVAGD
jgi:hypothetical protein